MRSVSRFDGDDDDDLGNEDDALEINEGACVTLLLIECLFT